MQLCNRYPPRSCSASARVTVALILDFAPPNGDSTKLATKVVGSDLAIACPPSASESTIFCPGASSLSTGTFVAGVLSFSVNSPSAPPPVTLEWITTLYGLPYGLQSWCSTSVCSWESEAYSRPTDTVMATTSVSVRSPHCWCLARSLLCFLQAAGDQCARRAASEVLQCHDLTDGGWQPAMPSRRSSISSFCR